MEAQNLRFVRCPKCLQLLVEYPSIPVYQCGGCGTILRGINHRIFVEYLMQRKIEVRK
uniref:Enhanced disease resistance 4-like N-terminal domain-containing protein n=1 Tax=Aegilops tauschii subsp. strangulata TaxID=200361 RepID=A0A453HPQ2_AEGTS